MHNLSQRFDAAGPVIDLVVGVSEARKRALVREGKAIPASVPIKGFLDTGSDGLAIDVELLNHLGIPTRGFELVHTMEGIKYCLRFDISVYIPMQVGGPLNFIVEPCIAFSNLRPLGFDTLIGRHILQRLVFTLEGPAQVLSLAYP
jgi:hypothetical protein